MKEIMEKKGELELTIVQGVFIGPGRNGKSSLMKRLLREKLQPKSKVTAGETPAQSREQYVAQARQETPAVPKGENHGNSIISPSTSVAKKPRQIVIKRPSCMAAEIASSNLSVSSWSNLSFDQEVVRLLKTMADGKLKTSQIPEAHHAPTQGTLEASLTSQMHSSIDVTPPSTITKEKVTSTSERSTLENTATCSSASSAGISTEPKAPTIEFKTPNELFKDCLRTKNWNKAKEYLENTCIMYLTDTGGQIEFQELLPALVSGPSVFFIVFRLDWDLDDVFDVYYTDPEKGNSKPYKSSIKLKDALLQSLASIASMGTLVYKGKEMQSEPLHPVVFFVGTHRDLDTVTDEKIKEIDSTLKAEIRHTPFYKDGIVQSDCKNNRLLLVVNNLADDDSDFQTIREEVERIIKQKSFKVRAPPQWLIFSLALRQETIQPVISFEQCAVLAKECGIHDTKELKQALRFLSTRIGLIRHFPNNNFEDLSKIVIRDPVIIFDKITKLVVETFTFLSQCQRDNIVEKGFFQRSVFDFICKDEDENELTASRLLTLLKSLHIIAPVQKDGKEVFFMPLILSHAEVVGDSTSKASVRTNIDVPPLFVCFKCEYCPKGIFPSLVAYLLNNGMKSKYKWKPPDKNYKDQFTFTVDSFPYYVTLIVTPAYIEVRCKPTSDTSPRLEKICSEIRTSIEKGIKQITSDLHYIEDAKYYLGFKCKNYHGAEFKSEEDDGEHITSLHCHRCSATYSQSDLPKGYMFWFPEAKVRADVA